MHPSVTCNANTTAQKRESRMLAKGKRSSLFLLVYLLCRELLIFSCQHCNIIWALYELKIDQKEIYFIWRTHQDLQKLPMSLILGASKGSQVKLLWAKKTHKVMKIFETMLTMVKITVVSKLFSSIPPLTQRIKDNPLALIN